MKDRQVGNNIDDYEVMLNRSLERISGMRTLIMDMLDLTKLESNKKALDVKKIDIVDIATLSKDTMTPMAIQKNIKIFIDSNPEHIFLLAEPEKIEIIFNNLISNAVKYNKDNGEVNCVLREENNKIKISVSDTGIGMSEEDIPKLFQEFMRIKNEKTKAISGSGLGLSILKKIVEEVFHGSISVASIPDKGTTFTIEIPKINIPL